MFGPILFVALALAPGVHRTTKPATAAFRVLGPAGFPIVGKTGDITVSDDGARLAVVVDLRRLDTGMKFRDDHMRDKYLEVARFPSTQLAVARDAIAVKTAGVVDGKASGDVTLHGVTKRLPFRYRAACDANDVCDVSAHVDVDMNEFGIVVAPYLGMSVQRSVAIDVAFQVVR